MTMSNVEYRHVSRQELLAVTSALIVEFAGRLSAGTVVRCVARSREQLMQAGVRAGLADAAEAMARMKLSAMVPPHTSAA